MTNPKPTADEAASEVAARQMAASCNLCPNCLRSTLNENGVINSYLCRFCYAMLTRPLERQKAIEELERAVEAMGDE